MGLGLGSAGVGISNAFQEQLQRRLEEEAVQKKFAQEDARIAQQKARDVVGAKSARVNDEFRLAQIEEMRRKAQAAQGFSDALRGGGSSEIGLAPVPPLGIESEAPTPGLGLLKVSSGQPDRRELTALAVEGGIPTGAVNAALGPQATPQQPPGSVSGAAIRAFLRENPNASTEEILEFNGRLAASDDDPILNLTRQLINETRQRDIASGFTPLQQANAFRLSDDFDKQSQDFLTRGQSFDTIQATVAGDPSPAGDISLIFAYMKMLDPTSVVREGEQATAANARGVDEFVRDIYNQTLGGMRLTPEQRADFLNQARNQFEAALRRQERLQSETARRAKMFDIPEDFVMVDYSSMFGLGSPQTTAPETPSAETALPPGATSRRPVP